MKLLQHLPKNFVLANFMLDLPTKSRTTEVCINMLRGCQYNVYRWAGMVTRKFDLLNRTNEPFLDTGD